MHADDTYVCFQIVSHAHTYTKEPLNTHTHTHIQLERNYKSVSPTQSSFTTHGVRLRHPPSPWVRNSLNFSPVRRHLLLTPLSSLHFSVPAPHLPTTPLSPIRFIFQKFRIRCFSQTQQRSMCGTEIARARVMTLVFFTNASKPLCVDPRITCNSLAAFKVCFYAWTLG